MGVYYIRKSGTDLYYTRPVTYTGVNTALSFQAANADRDLQKWTFTFDTNKLRYKITPAPVGGVEPGDFIRETGTLADGTIVYFDTWHTYNLYYNAGSKSYAIFNDERPALSQWSLQIHLIRL